MTGPQLNSLPEEAVGTAPEPLKVTTHLLDEEDERVRRIAIADLLSDRLRRAIADAAFAVEVSFKEKVSVYDGFGEMPYSTTAAAERFDVITIRIRRDEPESDPTNALPGNVCSVPLNIPGELNIEAGRLRMLANYCRNEAAACQLLAAEYDERADQYEAADHILREAGVGGPIMDGSALVRPNGINNRKAESILGHPVR